MLSRKGVELQVGQQVVVLVPVNNFSGVRCWIEELREEALPSVLLRDPIGRHLVVAAANVEPVL